MTITSEIDTLVVRHIEDIETASARIIDEIEPAVATAMGGFVQEWSARNGWSCSTDFESDDLCVWPSSFHSPVEADDWFASFYVSSDEQGWVDQHWLAALCGVGKGTITLNFVCHLSVNRRLWKRFLANAMPELEGTGFRYSENGYVFVPVVIDPNQLAQAIQDEAIELALGPLAAALDKALGAKERFDALLERARVELS